MNILTFSQARADFEQALDAVCKNHEPTVITRQRGEHVVMMSLEDYNSLQETLHLLSTPTNSDRLRQSIAEFRASRTFVRELVIMTQKKKVKNNAAGVTSHKVAQRTST
ncbi:type II toxin-antitoxin system Phd/YefM family antitoxin [Trinickia dinghuensis]|uniref:Antitoxin n=1 Tax=Trinickia dinghuensis TaxID=2291023 RepID=A0A3D8JR84_9BURK|nr:type II toxin-antitoxin system prevent-host-death family antitoxin [Trinickia dinghuensis]RDU95633.1 type II toxin-antitoxin system prevent-host-death family antitoxin [Trinickia dinghuensis]